MVDQLGNSQSHEPEKKIKLLLVDDDDMTRGFMKQTVLAQSGLFEIVGEAENGKEGLLLIEKLLPELDIVIFDIQMPEMDGKAFATALVHKFPKMKRVVLTSNRDKIYLHAFLYLGVQGYLHKSCSETELREVLLGVMQGGIRVAAKLNEGDTKKIQAVREEIEKQVQNLTPKERRVLKTLLTIRSSNENIAKSLGTSVKSVSFHLSNIYSKLGVIKRDDLLKDSAKWMVCLSSYPDEEIGD